jgi:hypothetical protein
MNTGVPETPAMNTWSPRQLDSGVTAPKAGKTGRCRCWCPPVRSAWPEPLRMVATGAGLQAVKPPTLPVCFSGD